MEKSRSRRLAGALLAALAVALLAPLAALARVPPPARAGHACHCPVKMPCCEAGLCHGGEDDAPSSSPSWSGCRDEAPAGSDVPLPSGAFDTALPGKAPPLGKPVASRSPLPACAAGASRAPAPSAPPPRGSGASR
jgi:hypothetical protein